MAPCDLSLSTFTKSLRLHRFLAIRSHALVLGPSVIEKWSDPRLRGIVMGRC